MQAEPPPTKPAQNANRPKVSDLSGSERFERIVQTVFPYHPAILHDLFPEVAGLVFHWLKPKETAM
jgi:hypothetical protein